MPIQTDCEVRASAPDIAIKKKKKRKYDDDDDDQYKENNINIKVSCFKQR